MITSTYLWSSSGEKVLKFAKSVKITKTNFLPCRPLQFGPEWIYNFGAGWKHHMTLWSRFYLWCSVITGTVSGTHQTVPQMFQSAFLHFLTWSWSHPSPWNKFVKFYQLKNVGETLLLWHLVDMVGGGEGVLLRREDCEGDRWRWWDGLSRCPKRVFLLSWIPSPISRRLLLAFTCPDHAYYYLTA